MNRLLRHGATNAVCISLFSLFYAVVFFVTSGSAQFRQLLAQESADASFWARWSAFLAEGRHAYIAAALLALSALVVVLIALRRHPYDEYHISILTNCLLIALFLILIAVALFVLMILADPSYLVAKVALFVVAQYTTVVIADLCYVLLCRWR